MPVPFSFLRLPGWVLHVEFLPRTSKFRWINKWYVILAGIVNQNPVYARK
jgi:hypothetical protein